MCKIGRGLTIRSFSPRFSKKYKRDILDRPSDAIAMQMETFSWEVRKMEFKCRLPSAPSQSFLQDTDSNCSKNSIKHLAP